MFTLKTCSALAPSFVIARFMRATHQAVETSDGMYEERCYFVYIMASKPYGTLYVGVTNNLINRANQHREGFIDGFTKKYGVKTLVYFEIFPTARSAIHREKRIKKWPRAYKVNLIMAENPRWDDLFEQVTKF